VSLLVFFVALSTMILAHELGHFLMAKKKGLKVEEFGFGFPPRIWGRRIGETLYSINLLPMGGFVKIWGMEEKVKKERKRAFYHQSKKVQGLILLAGVAMNFLLSVLVFSAVYGIKGIPRKIGAVKVIEVMADSPAEKGGLTEGAVIVSVKHEEEEIPVKNNQEFVEVVGRWSGEAVSLITVDNEELVIVPRKEPPEGEGPLGIVITDSEIIKPPLWQRVPLGIWYGFKEGIFWGKNIALGVGKMLAGIFRGRAPTDVAGPVGIYQASSEILKSDGLLAVIHFFAIISVNLVVVNLLPLPGTDGWHIAVLGFEKIRKKDINQETKRKINQAAMIVLLALFLLILIADLKRFVF